ncbi:phosphotransferase family protein [Paenibacillus koleovorans]|uniref:phosphotransferase family protein n=1 Tax=Paenibacillus koleovorans TaxID=121608 RepID=UPI000FDC7AFA|nr:phosphotransferase [Paenibacillus koleovorans]
MRNAYEQELLIQKTVERYISPFAKVIALETRPIRLGLQSQEVQRYKVTIQVEKAECEVFLVTKKAELCERLVLGRLQAQSAQIPFNYTNDVVTDIPDYICMQDVDHDTEYSKMDIGIFEKQIPNALAHIHASNYRLAKELVWLPIADRSYISRMLDKWWTPQWENAKRNEAFVEKFRDYIPEIEAVSASIVDEMEYVINDEPSHTLIHTDLHPGNVLCSSDNEVFFIDWADAHYGSFYFDIATRFNSLNKAQIYREKLVEAYQIEVTHAHFVQQWRTATRYIGIRYIAWTFGKWKNSPSTYQALNNYLEMIVR